MLRGLPADQAPFCLTSCPTYHAQKAAQISPIGVRMRTTTRDAGFNVIRPKLRVESNAERLSVESPLNMVIYIRRFQLRSPEV